MPYVILDLEWNGAYTPKINGYFNEIIEIGAVKLDEQCRPLDTFSALIRPVVSRKLTTLVQDLTGIEEEELKDGGTFIHAARLLSRWMTDDTVLMTWSETDLLVLLENCRYFLHQDRIPFLAHYMDLQAYCQAQLHCGSGQQLGLHKAVELTGTQDDAITAHRALDDSIAAGRVLAAVYDPQILKRYIRPADKAFYERLTYKPVVLRDKNDGRIPEGAFRFSCPDCGRPLAEEDDWQFRIHSLFCNMVCPRCHKKYRARVQAKLKYEGPVVKRHLSPQRPPQETEKTQQKNGGGREL